MTEKRMEIIALPKAQRLYTYANSQQISMQTGLIGHLRADFGSNGKQFFSSFFDFRKDLKSDAFKDEINTVFDFLREGSRYVDKNGAEIREHDVLRFEDGTEKEVFRLQDGSLGISVSNPAYLAAHPNTKEYYSTLSGWAPDGGIKKVTDGVVDFTRRPNRQEEAYVSCGSILKSRSALSAFCAAHPECGFAGNYTQEFGIRVNTPDYAYLLRLNPTKGDYNLYCYCYRRDWLDHHLQQAQKGIRFITPNYQTLFTLADGDKVRILNAHGGYLDESGKPRQRWESYKKLADAKQRKSEVEYKDSVGALVIPTCKTFGELLNEYVTVYGRQRWAPSTYEGNMGLINNYILPHLGNMRISDVNTRALDRFYKLLQKTKAVSTNRKSQEGRLVTPGTIRDINKIIRSCFNQAKKWELVERNPAENVTLPEYEPQKRDIWTSDVLFRAVKVCDDPRLTLALNLAFCCSLRIGEMLGLTWDCVDISEGSIEFDSAAIFIKKELQRVKKTSIQEIEKTGIQLEFPSLPTSSTALVLKKPKTASSIRKVFVPKTVAKMLKAWKEDQDEVKELMGDAYHDYGLVFAGPFGLPTEQNTIAKALKKLIEKHGFPPIVFHSFRHASVTYKLKLNGGDIKAVQGDTGHAQSKMVSDVYSHILDEGRRHNAQLFEKAFYSEEAEDDTSPAGGSLDVSALQKLLANPEAAALLAALAKSLK